MTQAKKAIILLSGGLDSATALACAQADGFDGYALSFNYGQRHQVELASAKSVCESIGVVEHKVVNLGLGDIGGSALTDDSISVPKSSSGEIAEGIPVTYVPARNTVFLSLALGWAEVLDADAYNAFKESGDIFNPELAGKFREYVLSKGGTVEPMELYRQFRGKDPDISPFLKRTGLN